MTRPRYFSPGNAGRIARETLHFSQAARVGDRLELAGQGGWNDGFEFPAATIPEEVANAFDNVERVLAAAGASWDDVFHVNSYHCRTEPAALPPPGAAHLPIEAEALDAMVGQFRLRMPRHAPIWTCLGVVGLGHPSMRVEIRVTAFLGSEEQQNGTAR